MFDILKVITLGIIEGVTEFLPISSTGHLIIANRFFNFSGSFANNFDIIIQFGAILAVVVYFWRRLWPFGGLDFEKIEIWKLWKKVLVALSPAIVFGGLLSGYIEKFLFNSEAVAIALVVGGIALILVDKRSRGGVMVSISEISYKTAFFIGLAQCLALVPGISRAGATIIGAMLFGASRVVATEFSFFLAVPTMLAASAFSLFKFGFNLTLNEIFLLSLGFIASFISAWFLIGAFLNYVSKNDFKIFGYYRILLGIAVLILIYFKFF